MGPKSVTAVDQLRVALSAKKLRKPKAMGAAAKAATKPAKVATATKGAAKKSGAATSVKVDVKLNLSKAEAARVLNVLQQDELRRKEVREQARQAKAVAAAATVATDDDETIA